LKVMVMVMVMVFVVLLDGWMDDDRWKYTAPLLFLLRIIIRWSAVV
jgi:hypothetical protein